MRICEIEVGILTSVFFFSVNIGDRKGFFLTIHLPCDKMNGTKRSKFIEVKNGEGRIAKKGYVGASVGMVDCTVLARLYLFLHREIGV